MLLTHLCIATANPTAAPRNYESNCTWHSFAQLLQDIALTMLLIRPVVIVFAADDVVDMVGLSVYHFGKLRFSTLLLSIIIFTFYC